MPSVPAQPCIQRRYIEYGGAIMLPAALLCARRAPFDAKMIASAVRCFRRYTGAFADAIVPASLFSRRNEAAARDIPMLFSKVW